MIVGELKEWRQVKGTESLQAAFEWLSAQDLAAHPIGTVEIDGKNLFAIFAEGPTRAPHEGKFESHRKYLDIQLLISGGERIYLAPSSELAVDEPYNEEKDLMFYEMPQDMAPLPMTPGKFAVFFPADGHLPNCHPESGPTSLKKVVVKVALDSIRT